MELDLPAQHGDFSENPRWFSAIIAYHSMKYFPICVLLFSGVFGFSALDAKASGQVSAAVTSASLDEFDKLLVEAWKLYQERKYDEAIKACEKLIVLRPEDNRGYAIAGAAYMGQFKMQEASDTLALAIKFSPRNPVLHYTKARADRFRNAKEDGLVSVRKAIELKPDYAEAYLLLGDLLGIGGKNVAEQVTAFRKAIELKPDLLPAYSELGRVLESSGDEKGATDAYRKAIALDPNKSAGLFHLGRLLVKQNRLKEARELWEKRPPNAKDNSFPNFITVLERAEKQAAAKLTYERNSNDPDALLEMGFATMDGDHWVVDGRQEKAIVFFRKALELKPDFAKAQYAICMAYVQIADTYTRKNKELDEELTKLRNMDTGLADKIVEYRRTYEGGLKGVPAGPPPAKKP